MALMPEVMQWLYVAVKVHAHQDTHTHSKQVQIQGLSQQRLPNGPQKDSDYMYVVRGGVII